MNWDETPLQNIETKAVFLPAQGRFERAMKNFVLLLAMALAMASSAQGDCSSMDLSPYDACTPAITSTVPSLPSASCCAAIKNADLTCLCNAILHAEHIEDLNREAALMLPKKCGVIPAGVTTCGSNSPCTDSLDLNWLIDFFLFF